MKKGIIVLLFVLVLAAVSCRQPREIVHTEYLTNTEYVEKKVYDSIYVDRYNNVYVSGDTVYNNQTVYQYKYRYIHDTTHIADTAYVTEKVTEVVEKKVPQWWVLWVAAGLYVIFVAVTKFIMPRI